MGTEGLYGIGNAKPQEIQQLRMAPALTLDNFALTADGVRILGNNQRIEYLLAGKQFDIHIVDGSTKTTLFSYVDCKAQNLAQNIPANAPIRNTFSFLALDVLDADGNSIMDVGDNAFTIATAAATAGLAAGNIGLQV